MAQRTDIHHYLNKILKVDLFPDYCPNGLQVEGRAEINKMITGVTASQALLDVAIEKKADAILVHHGYFWKGEQQVVAGIKKKRLLSLLENEVSLFAYHLPLDAHLEYGNNVQLANVLDITVQDNFDVDGVPNLFFTGKLNRSQSGRKFSDLIQQRLGREPLYIEGQSEAIETIAWCTGGAQRYIDLAVQHNVDAYLTGEASEATVHIARETGLHFYAAGHHATERYGVKALGEHLAKHFSIDVEFVDIPNPV